MTVKLNLADNILSEKFVSGINWKANAEPPSSSLLFRSSQANRVGMSLVQTGEEVLRAKELWTVKGNRV
ncbi:MAG: hypothetical protein QOF41_2419 [Methylobacteriaceae bacterium]|nr:hypothetical protein [Methylobacteriaceae bacterium]